uniref:Protein kinase domain-containing protein n=1 Tax=Pseudictyota dubia TaxID=2749911 RepID=A0A6U2AG01_9STRA|mmetsp:Transcript_13376/g.24950  ORF Transcript_13376/g.24950 Transcript_13376/m.24950 type:complete len:445 (+) Transcript_13376:943-2277(+)
MPSAAAQRALAMKEEEEAGNPLSGASVDLLLKTANDVVDKLSAETSFFDPERERLFPHLDESELTLGRVLGRGGFCVVNEIKKIKLSPNGKGALMDEESEKTKDEAFCRSYLQDRCLRNGDSRYAIKVLLPECSADPGRYLKGTIDLAVEAKFLSVLEHPNIVKMRALASVGHYREGNFLVLDRLYDTLEQRFKKWNRSYRKTKGIMGSITGKKKKKNKLIVDRLHVAHDLAAALRYMHGHRIIYRDLKPENAGFDIRDDVKIFDFGLAKELNSANANDDGTYKMTGFTGSLRYMAPEVALSKPYNFTADTYSFGTVLHEMISLQKPYDGFSKRKHADLVVRGDLRPDVPRSWPVPLRILIKRSWSREIRDRPSVESAYRAIRDLITKMRNGDDAGLEHAKRRSTHVLEVPPALGGGVVKGAEMRGSGGLEETRRTPSQIALAA